MDEISYLKNKKIASFFIISLFSLSIIAFMNATVYGIIQEIPYIIFISLYFIYILIFTNLKKQISILEIISLLYYLFSMIINEGGVGSWIIQIYIIILIIMMRNVYFSRFTIKYLFFLSLIIWLSWIVRSKESYYSTFINDPNLLNSNGVAEISLFCGELVIALISNNIILKTSKHKKIIYFLILISTFYITLSCQSRSAEIATIIFFICLFLTPKKIWNKMMVIIVTFLIFIGGSLFPFYYLSIQNNIQIADWVYNLSGKDLYSGRQQIWQDVIYNGFGKSVKNWLFGLGSNTNLGVDTKWGTNMHNSYWLLMLNFGIIGLILFFLVIMNNIIKMFKNGRNELVYMFAFWSFLVVGWSETILVWQMSIPFIFLFLGIGQNLSLKALCNDN